MECLRCSSNMKREVYSGILVDKCVSCGGIWLDKNEYESIKDGTKKDKNTIMTEAKKEIIAEKKRLISVVGLCPRCQVGSIKQRRSLGVEVDRCTECQGVFFDHKELETMISRDSSNSGVDNGFMGFLKAVFKKG